MGSPAQPGRRQPAVLNSGLGKRTLCYRLFYFSHVEIWVYFPVSKELQTVSSSNVTCDSLPLVGVHTSLTLPLKLLVLSRRGSSVVRVLCRPQARVYLLLVPF